jgi:hypothetical protein
MACVTGRPSRLFHNGSVIGARQAYAACASRGEIPHRAEVGQSQFIGRWNESVPDANMDEQSSGSLGELADLFGRQFDRLLGIVWGNAVWDYGAVLGDIAARWTTNCTVRKLGRRAGSAIPKGHAYRSARIESGGFPVILKLETNQFLVKYRGVWEERPDRNHPCSNRRHIRIDSVFRQPQTYYQSAYPEDGYRGADCCDAIEAFSFADLKFCEFYLCFLIGPLFGVPVFVFGYRISCRGRDDSCYRLKIRGWWFLVWGTVGWLDALAFSVIFSVPNFFIGFKPNLCGIDSNQSFKRFKKRQRL